MLHLSTSSTKTLQLSTQAAATITPGTSDKTAVSSGKYTTGAITVKGDSNLVAGNIKKGTSIFGVSGKYDPVSEEPNLIPENIKKGISLFGIEGLLDPGDGKEVITVKPTRYSTSITFNHNLGKIPTSIVGFSLDSTYGVGTIFGLDSYNNNSMRVFYIPISYNGGNSGATTWHASVSANTQSITITCTQGAGCTFEANYFTFIVS